MLGVIIWDDNYLFLFLLRLMPFFQDVYLSYTQIIVLPFARQKNPFYISQKTLAG